MIIGDVKISFPARQIFDETVQLILTIQYGDSFGTPTEYTPESLGLSVNNYGNLNLSFDLDDYLMTPADLEISLNDETKELTNHLFSNDYENMTLKAELKLNGVSEFNGSVIDDSINYDSDNYKLSFTFSSDTNKIDEVTLYNEDNEPLNPLDLVIDGYSRIADNRESTSRFPNALLKILQLVDENISLEIVHDWQFKSYDLYNTSEYDLEYVYVDYASWFNDPDNERMLGDLLKSIARTFSAQILVLNNSNAVFRKLYYYSSSNLQDVTVYNHSQGYKYHPVKYTSGKNFVQDTIYEFPNSEAYTEVSEDVMNFSQNNDTYFVEDGTASKLDYVLLVQDPLWENEEQSWFYLMELVPKVAHYYRSKKRFTRVDKFTLKGLGYSYAKNFNYNSGKYQILSMNKNLSVGVTNIEALYLGDT